MNLYSTVEIPLKSMCEDFDMTGIRFVVASSQCACTIQQPTGVDITLSPQTFKCDDRYD